MELAASCPKLAGSRAIVVVENRHLAGTGDIELTVDPRNPLQPE